MIQHVIKLSIKFGRLHNWKLSNYFIVPSVSDFARKTGDYGSLSPVDIQVMALAHQMTKEQIGTDHLKRLPENKVSFQKYCNLVQCSIVTSLNLKLR